MAGSGTGGIATNQNDESEDDHAHREKIAQVVPTSENTAATETMNESTPTSDALEGRGSQNEADAADSGRNETATRGEAMSPAYVEMTTKKTKKKKKKKPRNIDIRPKIPDPKGPASSSSASEDHKSAQEKTPLLSGISGVSSNASQRSQGVRAPAINPQAARDTPTQYQSITLTSSSSHLPGRSLAADESSPYAEGCSEEDPYGASYLFPYICLGQILVYLEAGSVPALLVELSRDFEMSLAEQGLLGGVVYLTISLASPTAGYLFKHYEPRIVLGVALLLNDLFTLVFALSPTGYEFSTTLFIFSRGLIGYTQAFLCVYSPLWVDEFAPSTKRTGWLSFLQGSVPLGVMAGYAIAAVSNWISAAAGGCWTFACWRYPFLLQAFLVAPFAIAVFFIPSKHIKVVEGYRRKYSVADDDWEIGHGTDTRVILEDFSVYHDSPDLSEEQRKRKARHYYSSHRKSSSRRSEEEGKYNVGGLEQGKFESKDLERAYSGGRGLSRSDLEEGRGGRGAVEGEDDKAFTSRIVHSESLSENGELGDWISSTARSLFSGNSAGEIRDSANGHRRRSSHTGGRGFRRLSLTGEAAAVAMRASYIAPRVRFDSFEPPTNEPSPRNLSAGGLFPPVSPLAETEKAEATQRLRNRRHSLPQTIKEDKEAEFNSPLRKTIGQYNMEWSGEEDSLQAYDSDQRHRDVAHVIQGRSASHGLGEALGADFDYNVDEHVLATAGSTTALSDSSKQRTTPSRASRRPSLSSTKDFAAAFAFLTIPVFNLVVFALSALYFVVTGIQFWGTAYMIRALHGSQYQVNILFVIVSATGPLVGVFFGGWLIDRLGGYEGLRNRVRTLKVSFVLGSLGVATAIPVTYTDNLYMAALLLWLLLFFGACVLSPCTGVFISVVPRSQRPFASSFSVIVFNLAGYFLSPVSSGWLMNSIRSSKKVKGSYFEFCDDACAYRIGFRFVLLWSAWSLVCLLAAWLVARAELRDRVRQRLSTNSTSSISQKSTSATASTNTQEISAI